MFLTFEGIDGSGKTTQARRLAEDLRAAGHIVTLTREPGGSQGAEEIRALLLDGEANRWSPESEILLFTAARRDHVEKTILPALKRGEIVICDRFADSTRVFQGVARGDLVALVDELHGLMIGIEPDLTLLFDLPADEGLARATPPGGVEQRFESMGVDFQSRVRAGFLELAARSPERLRIIDATQSPDLVAAEVKAIVMRHLGRTTGQGASAAATAPAKFLTDHG